jgi:hypothetical protein
MRYLATTALALALVACSDEARPTGTSLRSEGPAALAEDAEPNHVLFPRESRPYGADMETWTEREAQWIYAQPAAHNPLLDQTGADCGAGQDGPVWYIPHIAGPRVMSGSRDCAIPHDKALLLEIGAYVNTYPCPDPNFHPAPGQTLYDFLVIDAKAFMDGVNLLEVSWDGQPLEDVLNYRWRSDSLFYLTGDPSLAAGFDPCVTGTRQPAVQDGFFLMFKPPAPGQHTLVVHGTDVRGADKTYTYHLDIQ